MKLRGFSYALVATVTLVSTAFQPCVAQTARSLDPQSAAPLAASASTAVPALVPFSGVMTAPDGKPVSGETAITFLIFTDQEGGEPLFAETQAVTSDANGRYKVQLGATLANGLPADLFSTGEARWLEVQAAGQTPQLRVLIASVPYALKAADSATLGGLPASAFMLAASKAAADLATAAASAATTTDSAVTTTGGIAGYVPEFTGASTIADSPIFVSGADVGIGTTTPSAALDVNGTALVSGALTANGGATVGGTLTLPATGTATATAGYNSQPTKIYTSAYNSSSKAVVQPRFQWMGEVVGNDTATPSATLNLLSSTTTTSPAETGFHFNANGTINFAKGQTFPGTGTGNGTITAVTAGTGLTGGATAGNATLAVNQSVVAFQSDLTSAENTLNANIATAQSAAVSTSEYYAGNHFLGLGGGGISGILQIQGPPNTIGNNVPFNVLSVFGGNGATSSGFPGDGIFLAAGGGSAYFLEPAPKLATGGSISINPGTGILGYGSDGGDGGQIVLQPGIAGGGSELYSVPPGNQGNVVIVGEDNGALRNTPHQLQIQGVTNPNKQLLIGYLADSGGDLGYGAIQATVEGTVNTPLLLNPNGGGVGIQTTTVTNSLTIGQGQGGALADAWYTYSSRRFKTDIQTLPNALDKVEELRGVSYTLKGTGKREIGVIAEEVGKVVPEVVTYEKNGVDAQSVDYTRLTALLIEATKQQQAEIASQRAELTNALHLIKTEQAEIHRQAATISSLKAQVHEGAESVRQVRQRLATRVGPDQPTLVASR